jgi:hypothetical protein
LFCDTSPLVPINGIDPVVSPERKRLPEVVWLEVEANAEVRLVVEARVVKRLVTVSPPVEEALVKVSAPKRLVVPVTPRVEEALRAPEKNPVVANRLATVSPVVEAFVVEANVA